MESCIYSASILSFFLLFLKSFFGAAVRRAFLPQLPLLFKDGHLKKVCFSGVGRCVFAWVGGGRKAYRVRKKHPCKLETDVILPSVGAPGFCQEIKSFH